jgi:hypothetical protein
MPTLSYIAAFVIGVIVFAVLWNGFFDSASSVMVLAGMAGVAVMVTAFWIRNEMGHHNTKDK